MHSFLIKNKLNSILYRSEEVSSESKEKQEARKKKIFEAQIVCTTPSSLATQLMSDMIFPRVLIEDVEKLNEMEVYKFLTKFYELIKK